MAEETKPSSGSGSGGGKNIGMAVLCYIWILVLIPLLTDAKNDPFVKFHIKQGIVLLIVSIIAGAVSWIPVIGWLLGIGVFIVWLIGIINAASGKEVKLPVIGQFGDKFNI